MSKPQPPRIVGDDSEFVFELPPAQAATEPEPTPDQPRRVTLRVWQLTLLMVGVGVLVTFLAFERIKRPIPTPRPHILSITVQQSLNMLRPTIVSDFPTCEFARAPVSEMRIVLADGESYSFDSSLYLISHTGGDACRMDATFNARAPQWWLDGASILHVGSMPELGDLGLFTWSPPNQIHTLTRERFFMDSPQWSPDGQSVFFATNQALRKIQVGSQPSSSTSERALPFFMIPDAALSPDGQSVAYISSPNGVSGADLRMNWELYVSRLDEPEQRRLTENEVEDKQPAWSADGRWLAWASDRQIWLYDLVEDVSFPLIDTNDFEASHPIWLPTGDGIAFILQTPNTQALVAQMFSGEFRIINAQFRNVTSFDWR
jgi:Tol biopolymer transport system component